ncbi:MAG: hypothetical protein ACE5HE_07525 [Phycisphaerae bacterium]
MGLRFAGGAAADYRSSSRPPGVAATLRLATTCPLAGSLRSPRGVTSMVWQTIVIGLLVAGAIVVLVKYGGG